MRISAIAVTRQLDDAKAAAKELADGISRQLDFEPRVRKNSRTRHGVRSNCVGFLCCDSEMDHAALMDELAALLPIPYTGVGTSGGVITSKGYFDMAVSLQVIVGEDDMFHIDRTGGVTPSNLRQELAKLLDGLGEGFPESVKAVVMFAPFFSNVPFDEYVKIAGELGMTAPLFGGVSIGLDPSSSDAVLFALGQSMTDKIAVMAITGDARPVFAARHALSMMSENWHTVTSASGDIINSIDGMSAPGFLNEYGFLIDKIQMDPDRNAYTFTTNPLVLKNGDKEMDMLPRVILNIDTKAGTAQMSGNIPTGAEIGVGHMRRPDIPVSARECMATLRERMAANEQDGYEYSSILAVSCLGRYIVSTPAPEAESEALLGEAPEGLTVNGFYSWGEFCPSARPGGLSANHAYNLSIAMMAI